METKFKMIRRDRAALGELKLHLDGDKKFVEELKEQIELWAEGKGIKIE